MPRFAANLSTMYTELDFPERFAAAAEDGFRAVECQFPYDFAPMELAARLHGAGLVQVLINAPPGDLAQGERGQACLPDRVQAFRQGFVEKALPYARALKCHLVHVMAGLVPPGAEPERLRATYLDNLAWAAEQAASSGVTICVEPINARDVPGYFLQRQDQAHAVVQELGASNVKVQMDLYHCQIVEGDLAMKIRHYLPTGRVGHIQVAGVPDRHEPNLGEVDHAYLFALLDELGWDGWVGAEYRPRQATSAGLAWFAPWRNRS